MQLLLNNRKGFSLIELLIVIAIIGVLAVIMFGVFNGVNKNSVKNADASRATNIEKAITLLMTESEVTNLLTTSGLLWKWSTPGVVPTDCSNAGGATEIPPFTNNEAGVQSLIIALQDPIYVMQSGRIRGCGPYLKKNDGTTAEYTSFAPKYTADFGGFNYGYKIIIDSLATKANVQIVTSPTDCGIVINN